MFGLSGGGGERPPSPNLFHVDLSDKFRHVLVICRFDITGSGVILLETQEIEVIDTINAIYWVVLATGFMVAVLFGAKCREWYDEWNNPI